MSGSSLGSPLEGWGTAELENSATGALMFCLGRHAVTAPRATYDGGEAGRREVTYCEGLGGSAG